MTNGSSQGLFVIVAVVIFGIFVVISYLLFRDKLQTGLASIFDDSIASTNYIIPNKNLLNNANFSKGLDNWAISHNGKSELINKSSAPKTEDLPSNTNNILKITKSDTNASNVNWGYLTQHNVNSKGVETNTGTVVTISAWVYVPSNVSEKTFGIGYYDLEDVGWVASNIKLFDERDKWVYISYTKTFDNSKDKVFVLGFNNQSSREKLFFYTAGMKVEYGKQATMFTVD